MKLKRVILDNPIKFHEGRQTQWEQVIPSARYEAPKFELSYDPASALVSITLGATTKLVHASRVAQMEPDDKPARPRVTGWEDLKALPVMAEACLPKREEPQKWIASEKLPTPADSFSKLDKRTKAYRDSVKKAAQAVPGAISSPAKPEE